MLARGYTGTMPAFGAVAADRRQWAGALLPAVAALGLAAVGYGIA